MRETVRVTLLGPFEARRSSGEPLDLSGKKVQALVAYLAVEGTRVHTREELAALLWGQMGEERARHNLRQAISKIRRQCDALVVAQDERLQVNGERCEVDVREFKHLLSGDDPEDLERGLALYQHDLLEGLVLHEPAFDDWLRDARTRFREMALDALGRLADARTEAGQHEEAMSLHRRRLALDPACEPAHRGLMKLLAATGRRSDALRQYQHCVEALERELGAVPSAETKTAYERIRDGDEDAEPVLRSDPEVVTAPTAPEPPSVALLPLENLSGEEHRYFVDGITEDLITALSRFRSLVVIARDSSFHYRDRDLTVQQIGRELGACFIVRGSVRLAGSRIRVNVQLVDTSNGKNIWAQRFDRELQDVFLVQDEVTATVVSTLAGRVEASRLARARRAQPERLDAHDYVLRGKAYHHRYTAEDCSKAIEMFERAIERDPDYAVAHAWLACGLGQARAYRPEENEALIARAQEAAERARQLDEDDAECYRVLAHIWLLRHDLARAQSQMERSLFLNPNDDRAVCAMGQILSFRGRHEEGADWVRKAMRLNPYHPEFLWLHLGRALFHSGRHDEALSALNKVTRPRLSELVYRVAASAGLDDEGATRKHTDALRQARPEFNADLYVGSLPYEHEPDRNYLREALRSAGF